MLHQTQYTIKGMASRMGLHLVSYNINNFIMDKQNTLLFFNNNKVKYNKSY